MATAKIAHANVDTDGEAAGLALINRFNPNHFVKTALQYKDDTNPDEPGDQPGKWAERVVTVDGNGVTIPPATVPWPNSGALNLTGDYGWVRFVHDAATPGRSRPGRRPNGTTFTIVRPDDLGRRSTSTSRAASGSACSASTTTPATTWSHVDAFNVVAGSADPQTPGDDCGAADAQCPHNDEFDGTALDEKWEIVNSVPAGLSSAAAT